MGRKSIEYITYSCKLPNTRGCFSSLFCFAGFCNESQFRDPCLESIQSATPALSLPYYNMVRVIGNEFPASVPLVL